MITRECLFRWRWRYQLRFRAHVISLNIIIIPKARGNSRKYTLQLSLMHQLK